MTKQNYEKPNMEIVVLEDVIRTSGGIINQTTICGGDCGGDMVTVCGRDGCGDAVCGNDGGSCFVDSGYGNGSLCSVVRN